MLLLRALLLLHAFAVIACLAVVACLAAGKIQVHLIASSYVALNNNLLLYAFVDYSTDIRRSGAYGVTRVQGSTCQGESLPTIYSEV